MPGSSPPERYHLVAPLPPLGGWRRMLALDRRGTAVGPVVLSYAPSEVLEDPARLAALARDAEAGARVHHPNVLPVLGLETIDDQLVLVEPYRAGTTVRALLEASGRLPAELAVRVACDAAAGLAALHALDPRDGQPFAHGAVSAERVLVTEDGTSLVTGVGTGAGRSAADDVRALAGTLAEMVTGEPPRPGAPLDATGVPAALAAAIDRARGVAGDAQPRAAGALAEALGAAFPPAAAPAVAVYVGSAAPPSVPSSLPPASPAPPPALSPRPALAPNPGAIPEVSAELIAPGARVAPEPPEASAELLAPPDAARTFPAPRPAAPVRRGRPALVLAAVVIPGFLLGFAISRLVFTRSAGTPGELPAATSRGAPEPARACSTRPHHPVLRRRRQPGARRRHRPRRVPPRRPRRQRRRPPPPRRASCRSS